MPIVGQHPPNALTYRDPTGTRAVRRTPDHPSPTAPVPELRIRLCRAIAADDGHGTRLLAHLMARAVG